MIPYNLHEYSGLNFCPTECFICQKAKLERPTQVWIRQVSTLWSDIHFYFTGPLNRSRNPSLNGHSIGHMFRGHQGLYPGRKYSAEKASRALLTAIPLESFQLRGTTDTAIRLKVMDNLSIALGSRMHLTHSH
jgi:hypothetical protein